MTYPEQKITDIPSIPAMDNGGSLYQGKEEKAFSAQTLFSLSCC